MKLYGALLTLSLSVATMGLSASTLWAAGGASAKPDLVVPSVSLSPLTPFAGKPLHVNYTVKNQTAKGARATVTSLRINFGVDLSVDVEEARNTPALGPDEARGSSTVTFYNVPAGTHALTVCADARKAVAESDERNNCATKVVTVEARPNLLIQGILLDPPKPRPGKPLTLITYIENKGTALAKKSIATFDHRIGTKIGVREQSVIPLKPTKYAERDWKIENVTYGTHEVAVCADGTEEILETNEKDNCAKKIFLVQPEPDLVAASISAIPASPRVSEFVGAKAVFKNTGDALAYGSKVRYRLTHAPKPGFTPADPELPRTKILSLGRVASGGEARIEVRRLFLTPSEARGVSV